MDMADLHYHLFETDVSPKDVINGLKQIDTAIVSYVRESADCRDGAGDSSEGDETDDIRKVRDSYKRTLDRFDQVCSLTHPGQGKMRRYTRFEAIAIGILYGVEQTTPIRFPNGGCPIAHLTDSAQDPYEVTPPPDYPMLDAVQLGLFGARRSWLIVAPFAYDIVAVEDEETRAKRLMAGGMQHRPGYREGRIVSYPASLVPEVEVEISMLVAWALAAFDVEAHQPRVSVRPVLSQTFVDDAEGYLVGAIRNTTKVNKFEVLTDGSGRIREVQWQTLPRSPKELSVEELKTLPDCREITSQYQDGQLQGYRTRHSHKFS